MDCFNAESRGKPALASLLDDTDTENCNNQHLILGATNISEWDQRFITVDQEMLFGVVEESAR